MIISRTPYRLSLFGGGTDFPTWFRERGGAVLTTSINRYCYVSLRKLPPFFDHRFRVVYSQIENVREVSEIQHPVVRAALERSEIQEGMEIHHDGDLPAMSGIGSSSAFAVGLLNCIREYRGESSSSWKLGHGAVEMERHILKEVGGYQDQFACALGGVNLIRFHEDGRVESSADVELEVGARRLSRWLMLLYSGGVRSSTDVQRTLGEQPATRERVLTRLRLMVDEGAQLIRTFSSEHAAEVGALLQESWDLKRSLNRHAESAELAELATWMKAQGSLGGKISGAGGGGFALFCVPPDRHSEIISNLPSKWVHVPFSFENTGSSIIFNDSNTH